MSPLRLVADDLTGALDTAAEFVPLTGPVPVFWHGAPSDALRGHAALDLGTRELGEAAACGAMRSAVPTLAAGGIAFKKIDSLLRGQTLPELAACIAAGPWRQVVLAPAFPFQGRVTRSAQQFARAGDALRAVGPNLVDAMAALGVPAQPWRGGPLTPGVTVFDAEDDAGLDAAVAAGRAAQGPVLWCGTGGLARALAGDRPPPSPALPRPVLGLFGSDQAETAAQLAACLPHWNALEDAGPDSAARLAAALRRDGVALASHAMPPGTARDEAAARIGRLFAELVTRLGPPGTLAVAGGETLRGLCLALGATSLEVQGRLVPGVPVSTMRGGAWDGVTVVSKSGAFGHPTLLRELLCLPDLERTAS